MNATENFNSRPLRGERSLCVYDTLAHAGISIHAPCLGSDKDQRPLCCRQSYFNSRSLRGERLPQVLKRMRKHGFQFSLPAWEAMSLGKAIMILL